MRCEGKAGRNGDQMDKSGIKADFFRVGLGIAILLLGVGACSAEVACFRTPAQAAVQVGEQEGGGYRLEFVRADAFGHRNWASVRSCAHPEWPAVIVAGVVQPHLNEDKAVVATVHPNNLPLVMIAGRRVQVMLADATTRMQMTGVAQAAGRVGDTVLVRILAPGDSSEQRVVAGVVRSGDVVEIAR
jgi:hypothetical protein